MANGIETLLGLGLGPQDDMKALASSLRKEQAIGDYFSGSSSPRMAQYGQRLAERSGDEAKTGGALRQTMAKEATRKSEREQDYQRGLTASDLTNTRKIESDKQAQMDKIAIYKMKEELKPKKSTKLKPTGKATEDYLRTKQLITQISGVQDLAGAFTTEQYEMVDNPIIDTATDWLLPSGLERLAQEKLIYTDPAVKQYREKVADIESEFSKLMSGLAVSGFEMKDRKKWSPYAEGVSQETRSRRLENLAEKLNIQKGLKEQTYDFGSGGGSQVESPQGPVEEIVTEGEREGRPNFEEEREINGQVYGRIGDRWYQL